MSIRGEVLTGATRAVLKDRNATYGEPEDNFEFITDLWNVYKKHTTRIRQHSMDMPHDEAIHQIFVKIARIGATPDHLDSWTDIAGYSACGAECIIKEVEEPIEAGVH